VKRVWILCIALVMVLVLALPVVASASAPAAGDATLAGSLGVKGGAGDNCGGGDEETGWPGWQATTGVLGEQVSGNRYAIVVGISDYPGDAHVLHGGMDLSYADDDAVMMTQLLEGVYGFDSVCTLLDTDATQARIMSEIAALKQTVTRDDEVVLYFSGHGFQWAPPWTFLPGWGQVGVITWGDDPYGLGYLLDRDLKHAFNGFKTKRIVFIFDCCYSGGMSDLGRMGRVVCMSTTPRGLSAEVGEDYVAMFPDVPEEMKQWLMSINHGLFTYFFGGALAGPAYGDFSADFNGDSLVTVEEAFDFAKALLVEMSLAFDQLEQTPTIWDRFWNDLLL